MRKTLVLCLILSITGCNREEVGLTYDICPCRLFSQEQQEMFHKVAHLDYRIVATASGLTKKEQMLLRKARQVGLKFSNICLINKDIFKAANTDDARFEDFMDAVRSDHAVLWALRGGCGTYRIIDRLQSIEKPINSKTLIGFSDLTALNLFISQNWNWTVIHGPMFSQLINEHFFKSNFDLLIKILNHEIDHYSMDRLIPMNGIAQNVQSISGKVTGGNLSIIASSIATPYSMQADGKIIFIEDVSESEPKIYHMLYHLKQSGLLKKARAIILGEFVNCGQEIYSYLADFAQQIDIPVFATNKFGHGKINIPIVYNADSKIENGAWTIFLSEKRR